MPDCPLTPDVLPPNLRKHVDPASPPVLRSMAARGTVPMSPSTLTTALFMLTFDAEAEIAAAARASAASLPVTVLSAALRDDDLSPHTLDFFAQICAGRDEALEWICLNTTTPDETVARIAAAGSARICELVSQNQLRVLRSEAVLRALLDNPSAPRSTVDMTADFAVRSGVRLDDVPALVEARRRIFGEGREVEQTPTAEAVVQEFAVGDEGAGPIEQTRRLTLAQQVVQMSVAQKVKLALLGNKEARGLLLRDSNTVVAMAAIQSPRITEPEVLTVANSRTAPDDVLRYICRNREWIKAYPLKLALVKNPKVPLPTAMKFLTFLHDADIRALSFNRNVPSGVQKQARTILSKRTTPKRPE